MFVPKGYLQGKLRTSLTKEIVKCTFPSQERDITKFQYFGGQYTIILIICLNMQNSIYLNAPLKIFILLSTSVHQKYSEVTAYFRA